MASGRYSLTEVNSHKSPFSHNKMLPSACVGGLMLDRVVQRPSPNEALCYWVFLSQYRQIFLNFVIGYLHSVFVPFDQLVFDKLFEDMHAEGAFDQFTIFS